MNKLFIRLRHVFFEANLIFYFISSPKTIKLHVNWISTTTIKITLFFFFKTYIELNNFFHLFSDNYNGFSFL